MNQLLSLLLSLTLIYGYPAIVAVVLGGSFGLPIPVSTILVAAGSFSVNGSLNIFVLIFLATVAAIVGDIIGYYIGKKFGLIVINKFLKRFGVNDEKLSSVDSFLKKWGMLSIFTTRWLLTPLGVPVNVLAGLNGYSFKRFLVPVIIGELLWCTICMYLGYLFGANWVSITGFIGNTPEILALGLVGLVAFTLGLKMRRKP